MLGCALSCHGIEVETSEGDAYWQSIAPHGLRTNPFVVTSSVCDAAAFYSLRWNRRVRQKVRGSLEEYTAVSGNRPFHWLFFEPSKGLSRTAVKNEGVCRDMAFQIRESIADVVSRFQRTIKEVHVFFSGPKQLSVMLGRQLTALPPLQLYEYDGSYHPTFRID